MGKKVNYAIHILKSMIEERDKYFDKRGKLNSEGFKVLNKAIKSLATERPEIARNLKKARKKAGLEDIIKVFRALSPENV